MGDDASAAIDEALIYVKGGDGGNGVVSFRREKYVPRGGPDGGDGGRGGDVVLRGNRGLNTLLAFQHQTRFHGQAGGNGRGANQHGKRGADRLIDVPLGTVVREGDQPLADIVVDDQRVLVARGGKGGIGNVHFATSTNRAPRMARKGEPGDERSLTLELKSIADVGFVGEPNAGKSSLLAALTAARPEVAPYPFTTLAPNLGVAQVGDTTFVVVDVPGLIAGAHGGRGLGHRFLRHVQRARTLVHVVDTAAADPVASYAMVRHEMELFDPELLEKPELIAANKMDLPEARDRWPVLSRELESRRAGDVYQVSALTGEGVPELLEAMSERLEALRREAPLAEASVRTYRLPRQEVGFRVESSADGFRVQGRDVERIVAMADMESDEGLADLQRQLERTGLFRELEQAGVRPGDTVRIGDVELEWT